MGTAPNYSLRTQLRRQMHCTILPPVMVNDSQPTSHERLPFPEMRDPLVRLRGSYISWNVVLLAKLGVNLGKGSITSGLHIFNASANRRQIVMLAFEGRHRSPQHFIFGLISSLRKLAIHALPNIRWKWVAHRNLLGATRIQTTLYSLYAVSRPRISRNWRLWMIKSTAARTL